METKLTSKDYRLIIFCIILSGICLLFTAKYFYKAFPEASIDFKVTREQAKEVAQTFLHKLEFSPEGYRHAAIFSYHNEAKVFLERELGLEEANKIMGSRVKLWRWSNRWYKPLQKEEMMVRVSPTGEIIGFHHQIAEDADGAQLPVDSARVIAERFLATVMGIDLETIDFVEESSQERPNRMDHTFVWKDKDFDIHDATYRHKVGILGEQVGEYRQYLHVPDEWSRNYDKLRAKNDATAGVSAFFLFLTIFAMLCAIVVYTRHRDIRWKTALIFGAVGAVLYFLSQMNNLPLTQYNYPTTESYESFLIRNVLMDLLYAIVTGFAIFLLTAAAEPLYRERYSNKVSLTNIFRWRGIRTKRFFNAVIVGFTLTFFYVAFVVAFYLISTKLGGWAPQDIPYDNLLNTKFPWVFVLFFGFLPAVSEEFISRMFSIPFLHKFLKMRWLAVVIPAFIWGFAHANYPQQPFYIRGLEVGIIGIIVGYVMLRYGILATLVWHYTVDALFMALLLFRSGNSYFIITAAVGCGIMLLPLVIALVAYLRKQGFQSPETLTNLSEGVSRLSPEERKADVAPVEMPGYHPLSKRHVVIGVAVGILLLGLYLIPVERFGSFVKFRHTVAQAEKAATQFLSQQDFDVSDYKTVTYVQSRFDHYTAKYVLEHSDLQRLNQLYSDERVGACWVSRYFKPLQKDEYRVYLDARDLDMVAFERLIEENAKGADLPQDSALAIASTFVMARGIDVSSMKLQEASSEKRKNRRDYVFVWEAEEGDPRNLGEMKYRVRAEMQGDVISKITTYPKIPENWERERKKKTLPNALHLALLILVIAGFVVLAIIRFIRQARSGVILWKKVLIISGVVVAVAMLNFLNGLPTLARHYQTSIDFNLFLISLIIGILIALLGLFIGLGMGVGLVTAIFPESINTLKSVTRRGMGRDALLASIITILGLFGLERLGVILNARFPTAALIGGLPMPQSADALLPALSIFFNMLTSSFFIASIAGIIIFVLIGIVRKRGLAAGALLIAVLAFVPLSVRSLPELFLNLAATLPIVIWLLVVITYFLHRNYLAYLLVPFFYTGTNAAISLLGQENGFLTANAIAIVMAMLGVAVWVAAPAFSNTNRTSDLLKISD